MATWSLVFAAVAAVAAALSLYFAWRTVRLSGEAQRQYERDPRQQRLERIASKTSEVKWAAHHPSHNWMAPREDLRVLLDGTNEKLENCRAVLKIDVPTGPMDDRGWDDLAADVEERADSALKEVMDELNKLT